MNLENPFTNKPEAESKKVTWSNPDSTIGSGTEEDRREAQENWDHN